MYNRSREYFHKRYDYLNNKCSAEKRELDTSYKRELNNIKDSYFRLSSLAQTSTPKTTNYTKFTNFRYTNLMTSPNRTNTTYQSPVLNSISRHSPAHNDISYNTPSQNVNSITNTRTNFTSYFSQSPINTKRNSFKGKNEKGSTSNDELNDSQMLFDIIASKNNSSNKLQNSSDVDAEFQQLVKATEEEEKRKAQDNQSKSNENVQIEEEDEINDNVDLNSGDNEEEANDENEINIEFKENGNQFEVDNEEENTNEQVNGNQFEVDDEEENTNELENGNQFEVDNEEENTNEQESGNQFEVDQEDIHNEEEQENPFEPDNANYEQASPLEEEEEEEDNKPPAQSRVTKEIANKMAPLNDDQENQNISVNSDEEVSAHLPADSQNSSLSNNDN